MITTGNKPERNKTNHEEHRQTAVLFFVQSRTDGATHTDKERETKKEVRICYSFRTGIC